MNKNQNGAQERWLVVGGGFSGIAGACLLAEQGAEVMLCERAPFLGGVLHSIEKDGYVFDKGCHLFANLSDLSTKICLDILGENYVPISVRYASVMNKKQTEGFAIPVLDSHGEEVARKILWEVAHTLTQEPSSPSTLQDRLEERFGSTAAQLLGQATQKMYAIDAAEVASEALELTQFGRIAFLDNDTARFLKQLPALDDRIAASSQQDPLCFWREKTSIHDFREFYPSQGGMKFFCDKAKEHLTNLGVDLRLQTSIESLNISADSVQVKFTESETVTVDRVLWAADASTFATVQKLDVDLRSYVHHVPLVVAYFLIPEDAAGPYTYLHNFDASDHFFRASIPGTYGPGTSPEGHSYVCCEIPTKIGSDIWESPEEYLPEVWRELLRSGIATCETPLDSICVKTPTSYRLPKVGYTEAVQQVMDSIEHKDRVIGVDQWEFSKTAIIDSLQQLLLDDSGSLKAIA